MKILCTTISLILGLYFLRNNIVLSIVISLIYIVFIFVRFSKKYAFLLLTIFIGGAILGNIHHEYTSVDNIYSGIVVEVKKNYFIFESHFEKYYVYEKETSREIGDYLTIKANVEEAKFLTYESQLDFASYLKDKGVNRRLVVKNYNVDFANPIRVHSLKENLLSKYSSDGRDLVNAILFHDLDYSSLAISSYKELNLIYLLSSSGIYVHLIFAITTYIFGLFSSKKVSELVPILLYSPLLIFSFPKVGLLRIFIVSSLRYINEHFLHKKFTYLTLLSSVALIFVIIDYHLVYQSSFYIGFSLSLLSIFFRRSIMSFSKWKKRSLSLISINSFLFPIQSSNGNCLHLIQPLSGLVLAPLFLLFVIISFYSLLAFPLCYVVNAYSDILIRIAKALYVIDITLPISINTTFVTFYYVSLLVMMYLFESRRMRHLTNIFLIVSTFIVSSMLPIHLYTNAVYFIDVGQGDSILIQNKNKIVMIDTGGVTNLDIAKETLIPFLNKKRISHIDLLITTHDDFDHSGGVSSLKENFRVYNYLNRREDFPYQIGDLYFENINFYDGDENDSSLVFKLDFMGKKWLFTGDASIASEKAIIASGIDIDIDILKVGHHGSKTSSCDEFIKATSPTEAIISCGANNKFGHPNKEVIDILSKYGVKIRRTDLEGTISYVTMLA